MKTFYIKTSIKGLDQEILKEIFNIQQATDRALNYVGAEMTQNLQQHLHNDWYLAWKGKSYERRTDGASGTPLGSLENIDVEPARYGRLAFYYTPTGEYPDNTAFHTSDGDDLIRKIQDGDMAGNPPPRPFWDNFVEEQESMAFENFVIAMGTEGYKVIKTKADKIDFTEFKKP